MLKVVGAGYGRTGTASLKLALEQLGFDKCYHMFEVMQNPSHVAVWSAAHSGEAVDWDALFDGYQASVDWPACNHWQALSEHYPESKVLLSLRDSDAWYDSIMATIYGHTVVNLESEDPARRRQGEWAMEIIWRPIFGDMEDRAHVISVFEAHNERVQREVPADRLLVFDAKEGWGPLCAFLDVEVPDSPYPRTNTRDEFKARVAPSE